jgi:2-iminobutanoate/2-iminopropanoate deaminase
MPDSRKQKVESPDAPGAIGPYSQAIRCSAGAYLFVSGQIGVDPASGELVSETVEGQARQCLTNLMAIVREAGGSNDSVVKTTIYLEDMADFSKVNEVYSSFFGEPYPARACVGGMDLPKGALVEIDAIAVLGK